MKSSILPEHKELLSSQSESKTLPEWIAFFNNAYSKRQIYDYCYCHNFKIKKLSTEEKSKIQSQNSRKYNINQDYFKTWSREMAYIFGFWCADGCIYGQSEFDITIHKKDKYLLEQIAKELEYEGPLYDYVNKQAARLNFSCRVIYDDLLRLGGSPRKSLILKFPKVPKEYLSDFIRGYFDGDGCIMTLKNNRLNSAFTCGSKSFLDSLLQILKEEADVKGGAYDASCVSLKFGKADTIKIGHFIYKDEPKIFLKRKRDKFPS